MLTCLFSVKTVRPMRRGESSGKDNRLGAASTPALLSATNDQRSNLGIYCADQCSNTEGSANLGRADHEMRGSDLSSINRLVVRRLHRIDNECSTTRCAPRSGESCPRLDRAYFARGKREEPDGFGVREVNAGSLHHPMRVEGEQLHSATCGSVLRRQGTSATVLPRRRHKGKVRH